MVRRTLPTLLIDLYDQFWSKCICNITGVAEMFSMAAKTLTSVDL